MINILKYEFRKLFKSKWLWISLIFGMVIIAFQSYTFYKLSYLGNIANYEAAVAGGKYEGYMYPVVMIQGWIGQNYATFFLPLFYLLFPVIAVLPYGASLYTELNSGYLKNIFTRVNKAKYLACKYFVGFIAGGVAVSFPILLSMLISALYLPNLPQNPMMLQMTIGNPSMWSDIFMTRPEQYIFRFTLLAFIFGGLMSTIALGLAQFASNIFAVWLFQFLVNTCAYYFFAYGDKIVYIPMAFLNPMQAHVARFSAIVVTGVIMLAASLVLFGMNWRKKLIV